MEVSAHKQPVADPPAKSRRRFHIKALLWSPVVAAAALACYSPICRLLERPYLRPLLADAFDEKDQGFVIQQEAFRRPDVLPVYGSSEQRQNLKEVAAKVFYNAPTGFQVCPVGGAGNTSLMMALKIAAQGEAVRHHKVAFILSTSWFRRAIIPSGQLSGNFSTLQAYTFLSSASFKPALRDRFVSRLLEQPEAFDEQPMMLSYLRSLGQKDQAGGWRRTLLNIGLGAYVARLDLEDHENMLGEILTEPGLLADWRWRSVPQAARWDKLIEQKESETLAAVAQHPPSPPLLAGGLKDAEFTSEVDTAQEWQDLELLLDTLQELEAKPLIMSVPLPGWFLDGVGASRAARDHYYLRMQKLCAKYGYPFSAFSDHDLDRDFLEGAGTHLQAKGWLYVDRLLDDFYHDRLPPASEPQGFKS